MGLNEPFISVVIPAFNEELSIGSVLQGTREVLEKTGFSYEIIVVNDGSADRTAEVAREHDVVLVENDGNLGKGAALRAGFMKVRGEVIVMMDADGSHQPEDISRLICPVLRNGDAEVATGSRFVSEMGRNSTKKLHLVGNKLINTLILFLTGRYVSDSQSGFRAFRRDVLRRFALSSSGYEVESEMTIRMLKSGLRIREIPISCKQRKCGTTRINSFGDGFRILKAILKATFCG
ncbi:MAG: glycosyltransferase family 2 protein [Candidatus Bathyarchaeota archaeon]|nr:glycosyltransferase family 2 protein [Candidatus Bathyarchaeota archaeon]MDH5687285.1 glycosyltransferase family 2 protein [Candidatus Bathyarchaeota archaeon]